MGIVQRISIANPKGCQVELSQIKIRKPPKYNESRTSVHISTSRQTVKIDPEIGISHASRSKCGDRRARPQSLDFAIGPLLLPSQNFVPDDATLSVTPGISFLM